LNLETINQAYLFLIFILNGIIIGVIFDIFRILRKSFKTPNIVTYIEDVMFWVISAVIVMYSLFVFNNGEFRAYIFIGILLGVCTYMLFFSRFVVNISVTIIEFIKKCILFIIKAISYPVKMIYNIIRKIIINPVIKIMTKFNKMVVESIKRVYNNKKRTKIKKTIQNKEGI